MAVGPLQGPKIRCLRRIIPPPPAGIKGDDSRSVAVSPPRFRREIESAQHQSGRLGMLRSRGRHPCPSTVSFVPSLRGEQIPRHPRHSTCPLSTRGEDQPEESRRIPARRGSSSLAGRLSRMSRVRVVVNPMPARPGPVLLEGGPLQVDVTIDHHDGRSDRLRGHSQCGQDLAVIDHARDDGPVERAPGLQEPGFLPRPGSAIRSLSLLST